MPPIVVKCLHALSLGRDLPVEAVPLVYGVGGQGDGPDGPGYLYCRLDPAIAFSGCVDEIDDADGRECGKFRIAVSRIERKVVLDLLQEAAELCQRLFSREAGTSIGSDCQFFFSLMPVFMPRCPEKNRSVRTLQIADRKHSAVDFSAYCNNILVVGAGMDTLKILKG